MDLPKDKERTLPPSAEHDYTTGSLNRNIWLLAVPMIADQSIGALYQLVDLFFLGRLGEGEHVLAAFGLGSVITFILFSVGMGVGVAGVAVVARRVGQRDVDGASQGFRHAVGLAALVGAVVGGVGILLARPLLLVLGAGPAVAEVGTPYLQTLYAVFVIIMPTYVTNNALRGAGEARTALRMTLLMHGVAVVLCPVLIFHVGLGMVGSPLAYGVGCLVGWLWAIRKLRRGDLRLKLTKFHYDGTLVRRMVAIGLPSSVQMLFRSASRLALMPVVSQFGPAAVAAYGMTIRVIMLPLAVSFGTASASAALVGQNLGARQPQRAARSAWLSAAYSATFMALAAVVVVVFAEAIMGILSPGKPSIVAAGAEAMRVIALSAVFSGLGIVMGRSLDGAGNTVPPMLINLATLWLIQLPLAYSLPWVGGLGATGIWLGIALANVCNALLMAGWFHQGHWKHRVV